MRCFIRVIIKKLVNGKFRFTKNYFRMNVVIMLCNDKFEKSF